MLRLSKVIETEVIPGTELLLILVELTNFLITDSLISPINLFKLFKKKNNIDNNKKNQLDLFSMKETGRAC